MILFCLDELSKAADATNMQIMLNKHVSSLTALVTVLFSCFLRCSFAGSKRTICSN